MCIRSLRTLPCWDATWILPQSNVPNGNTGDVVTERGLIPGSGEQNKEQSEVDYTGMRFSSTYDALYVCTYVFFPSRSLLRTVLRCNVDVVVRILLLLVVDPQTPIIYPCPAS